jgi:hypothetical protein
MIRNVRVHKFCELSGYTESAVYQKINTGVWREGHEWHRAPDGHILIDQEGFDRWVEGQRREGSRPTVVASN